MTDKKDDQPSEKKTLSLKRSGFDASTAKTSFRQTGRAKALVVETKRRKFVRSDADNNKLPPIATVAKPRIVQNVRPRKEGDPKSGGFNNNAKKSLSSKEMDARLKALQEETIRAEQEKIQKEKELERARNEALAQEARERAQREKEAVEQARKIAEQQQAEQQAQEQQAEAATEAIGKEQPAAPQGEAASRAQASEEAPAIAAKISEKEAEILAKSEQSEEASEKAIADAIEAKAEDKASDRPRSSAHRGKHSSSEEEEERKKPARRNNNVRPDTRQPKINRGGEERRRAKLSLNSDFDEEGQARGRSIAAMRRRQEKIKRSQIQETREKISREVTIPEVITIQELAQRMAERAVDVIKYLMTQGQMMKPGDVIDADMAQLIAEEFGHSVKRIAEADVEADIFNRPDDVSKMVPRPPVVTVMGHVDHGKTSLLDAIRKANVVAGEAGGITQHIGAYQVEHQGQKITFIDTPGHAAFTAMRARGAQATDIAILVVAADDGVMPQTIEAINHAKAAQVPIIVAINKIDKPGADANRVRTELLQHEVFVESMGGETLDVELSALTGQNLDKLLESITLQAEILDLKAEADRPAEGVVIEAKLDKGRGSVATLLIQKGTLYPSNIIIAGNEWGRIRAMTVNEAGASLKEAGPSTPVEILGLQGTPQAGDRFAVATNEAQARNITAYRQRLAREKAAARHLGSRGSLEQMMNKLQFAGVKEFCLLIKADVQGSIEAIRHALEQIGNDEVQARIIHAAVGGISETDIALAQASNAAIIGFNVRANKQARDNAARQDIEIRYYNVIYDLIDDIKAAMSGMLTPERRETFLGNAEILEVFNISKVGKVAGCRITEGKIERGAGVRLIRDNVVIHEGQLKTLKRFKDEVSEAYSGQECGMAFENYEDIRAGDVIEAFLVEQISRSL